MQNSRQSGRLLPVCVHEDTTDTKQSLLVHSSPLSSWTAGFQADHVPSGHSFRSRHSGPGLEPVAADVVSLLSARRESIATDKTGHHVTLSSIPLMEVAAPTLVQSRLLHNLLCESRPSMLRWPLHQDDFCSACFVPTMSLTRRRLRPLAGWQWCCGTPSPRGKSPAGQRGCLHASVKTTHA